MSNSKPRPRPRRHDPQTPQAQSANRENKLMPDVIYILINEAMPGFVKVGRTSTSVEQRMKELDNTSMPLPFECFHAAEVPSGVTVERLLLAAFKDKRIRKRREFFKIDPEQVRSALLLAQTRDVTPRDDVFEEVEDVEALNKARNRRGGFSFEDVTFQSVAF